MRIRVQGGHPLNGTYTPSGNTNAAVALLAASMLTDQPVTLHNVPDTSTVSAMLAAAASLGAAFDRSENNTLTIQTEQVSKRVLNSHEMGDFRAALLYLVPVLVRRQYARLEFDLPLNRIRTHLDAMRDLGLDVVTVDGAVELRAADWDYKDIILTQTSVTATVIALMLAAAFGQETVIRNAASEPHVQELANLLEMMGAQIHGIGSNVLRVFGIGQLHGADVNIGPDHIETASVAALAAMSGGRIQLQATRRADLRTIAKSLDYLGVQLDMDATAVFVPRHETLVISNRQEDVDASIKAAPWPGFPSDLIGIATVVATQARGTSLIHEPMYDNRLLFVDKLNAMGAQIVLCDPHRAIVVGESPLHPIYMDSPDVRTGLGMLAAALVAHGETVIDNAEAFQVNFDGVIDKLQRLGAQIVVEAE